VKTIPIAFGVANSRRADACDCGAGMPCECNPCGGINEPPKLSPIARVTLDKNGPRH
jgi:hypothetical protein